MSVATERPEADRPSACPRCGAALRPDQDWCLSCGTAVTTEIAGTRGWRTPVAIVGVVLTLAAAALVVAFLELSDDADRLAAVPAGSPTPAAIPPGASPTPAPPAPTPTPAPATPSPTPGVSPSPGPSPGATASPVPGATPAGPVAGWPAGREAWTVVLVSATSREAAEKRARELQAQGRPTGVLRSDEFSSLRAGYWVVFSGQFEDQDAAEEAADGFRSSVPEAYARLVKPR